MFYSAQGALNRVDADVDNNGNPRNPEFNRIFSQVQSFIMLMSEAENMRKTIDEMKRDLKKYGIEKPTKVSRIKDEPKVVYSTTFYIYRIIAITAMVIAAVILITSVLR